MPDEESIMGDQLSKMPGGRVEWELEATLAMLQEKVFDIGQSQPLSSQECALGEELIGGSRDVSRGRASSAGVRFGGRVARWNGEM